MWRWSVLGVWLFGCLLPGGCGDNASHTNNNDASTDGTIQSDSHVPSDGSMQPDGIGCL